MAHDGGARRTATMVANITGWHAGSRRNPAPKPQVGSRRCAASTGEAGSTSRPVGWLLRSAWDAQRAARGFNFASARWMVRWRMRMSAASRRVGHEAAAVGGWLARRGETGHRARDTPRRPGSARGGLKQQETGAASRPAAGSTKPAGRRGPARGAWVAQHLSVYMRWAARAAAGGKPPPPPPPEPGSEQERLLNAGDAESLKRVQPGCKKSPWRWLTWSTPAPYTTRSSRTFTSARR